MSRYIDVDKLLDDIECIDISDCTDIDNIFIEVEKTIDEQPTADVVEVVRCKDCKYLSENKFYCKYFNIAIIDNGFCYRGARMDGETNDR